MALRRDRDPGACGLRRGAGGGTMQVNKVVAPDAARDAAMDAAGATGAAPVALADGQTDARLPRRFQAAHNQAARYDAQGREDLSLVRCC